MEEIRFIIGRNITELRNKKGITQADLAEALNYSDKAVSKWERGESMPGIVTLSAIAGYFDVPLDYFTTEEHGEQPEKQRSSFLDRHQLFTNQKLITGISISGIWVIALFIFIILNSMQPASPVRFLVFAYAVPLSLIVWLVFNSLWFRKSLNALIISLLTWTLLASVYLTLKVFDHNIWEVFLLGIPGEIIIILSSGLKKIRK